MKKMIAYRMDEESIGKIARMAHALRITKTAVIEYALDYCCDNETFIGYSMDRREGNSVSISAGRPCRSTPLRNCSGFAGRLPPACHCDITSNL